MIKILLLLLLPFTILAGLGTPAGNSNGEILGIYAMCGTNPVDCKTGWCCVAGEECLSSTSTTGTPLCMDSSVPTSPHVEPLADLQKIRQYGQRCLLRRPAAPPIGPECHFDHVRRHIGRRYDYQCGALDSPDAALYCLSRCSGRRIPVALGVMGSFLGGNLHPHPPAFQILHYTILIFNDHL
jgi:hypothetical protein